MDILGTQASIAVWVKPLGTHTHYNGTIASSGNWNAKKWAFGVSQDNSKVDVLCGSYNTYITCAVPTNEWTHLVSTFDNGTCKLYKNGEYVGQLTGQKAFETDATNACIARETYASGYFGFNGCVNDVRIYDHCLSAAEVKEISQGLVLHYKLDSFQGGYGNPNLYTGSRDFSGTWGNSSSWGDASETYQGFKVKRRANTWSGLHQVVPCAQNDIFTISFYGKVESGGNIMTIHRSNLGNVTTGLTILDGNFSNDGYWVTETDDGTQWKRYWATLKITGSDVTSLKWRIENSVSGKYCYVCGMKLEKGSSHTGWSPAASEYPYNTIQDDSGYGHNGTINGTLTLFNDAARYSTCGYFGEYNTPNVIVNDTSTFSPALTNCTVTWWGKYNTTKTLLLTGQTTSYYIAASDNNTYYHRTVGSNTKTFYKDGVAGSYECAADGWHFFAVTGLDLSAWTALKLNGYSSGWPLKGYINDLRIYSTVLSPDDILSLYHTSAKVDNLGGLHTFEFQEKGLNKIYKAGITQGQEISEIDGMSNLKYDSNIYIEPDGSAWVRIFHHNNPTSYKFVSGDTFTTGVYKDENRWFNFDLCNYTDKWEFIVKSKATPDATEYKYRWIQTKNPLTATFADVAAANVTKITTTGYTSYSWGGLYKINSSTFLCTNNGTNGNWWGAVGAWNAHQGGIPGWTTVITTGYEDVYLRIDNITTTMPTIAKSTKNNIWIGHNLIEK